MQESLFNNRSKYTFVLNNFEGPLDLLLYLIGKNKMNIFDISLSELTDEYIKYINELTEKNIEVTSEFIVMAATLLDIKARKLIPQIEPKEDEEEVLTEEDIIQKIILYKKYKEVSNIINGMYRENFGSFSKPFEKIKYKEKTFYTGQAILPNELHDTYIRILELNKNKINKKAIELEKLAVYEKYTVKDKVRQIIDYLEENKNMVFNNIFNTTCCDNVEVVTAFLGALELSKLNQVSLNQEYLFSDINISKNNSSKVKIDLSQIFE